MAMRSVIAILFYIASAGFAFAEEQTGCTEEKAIEVVKASRTVAEFCKNTIVGQRYACEYKAAKSSPVPEQESNLKPLWFVTVSTPELAILGRVSDACELVIRQPFYLKPIELGSIELGIAESSDIVIGKVIAVDSPDPVLGPSGSAAIQLESVTVEVHKVLKGEQISKITFGHSFSFADTSAKQLWLNNGHDMLFFVSSGRVAGSSYEKIQPALIGNWPNAITLETGKTSSGYPVFTNQGDILKTQSDILNAVQTELAHKTNKSSDRSDGKKDVLESVHNVLLGGGDRPLDKHLRFDKIQMSADKYQEAYKSAIPQDSIVIIDIPKE